MGPTMAQTPLPLPVKLRLRGVSHYQDAVTSAVEGQPLVVVHEADNAFDPNACAVTTTEGDIIGYVPSVLAGRLLATGARYFGATVSQLLPGQTWGVEVQVVGPIQDAGSKLTMHSAQVAARAPKRPGPAGKPSGGTAVSTGTAPQVTVPGEETAPRPCKLVSTRAGRPLGTLVSADDSKVVVKTASGLCSTYPAHLVVVGT